jgi:molybdate transport system substrate-binding protein
MPLSLQRTLGCFLLISASVCAQAEPVRVAVAANFAPALQAIATEFEKDSGHKLLLSVGATGKFYSQIRNGAPFDVLLSADDETPARLVADGAAVAGSEFTYALGRLVLWSAQPELVDDQGAVLRRGDFRHLALANPKTAPYGAAAIEALGNMRLRDGLAPKFVQGENVAQVLQFTASGNAELGFVALSQVWKDGQFSAGSAWLVPAHLHSPIRQDAVLLVAARNKPEAHALTRFLKGDKARAIVRSFGYELPPR